MRSSLFSGDHRFRRSDHRSKSDAHRRDELVMARLSAALAALSGCATRSAPPNRPTPAIPNQIQPPRASRPSVAARKIGGRCTCRVGGCGARQAARVCRGMRLHRAARGGEAARGVQTACVTLPVQTALRRCEQLLWMHHVPRVLRGGTCFEFLGGGGVAVARERASGGRGAAVGGAALRRRAGWEKR